MVQALSTPGLDPLAFLERSAMVYPKKPAVIYRSSLRMRARCQNEWGP